MPAIAVAVSGGGDSMALAHMLSRAFPDKQFHALTVDHGLRPESAAEAVQVGVWLGALSNVMHRVLLWEGVKPETGKMEAAREARYALMAQYCREHNLSVLALAHHGDDQAETFFMRLVRGSGLDGLSGMRPVRAYDDHLTLWRPLLREQHADLLQYCRDHGVTWVEDPTNKNPDYTRTRLRKLSGMFGDEGLSAPRLATTLKRLARAQDALETLSERLARKALISNIEGQQIVYDLGKLRAEPFELSVRILRRAIKNLRGSIHGARYDRIETVAQACLFNDDDATVTLGGCIVQTDHRRGTLRIRRENS